MWDKFVYGTDVFDIKNPLSLFANPISTKQAQRIFADNKELIYLIFMDDPKVCMDAQKVQEELTNGFNRIYFTQEDNPILKIQSWQHLNGSTDSPRWRKSTLQRICPKSVEQCFVDGMSIDMQKEGVHVQKKSGLSAANKLLGYKFNVLQNVKHRSPTWTEYSARLVVTSFLRHYIKVGSLRLEEAGGSILTFGEQNKSSSGNCVLRIHHSSFYWKIATRADLGLADAFIDGDFTCVDTEKGLLNLFLILISNRDESNQSSQNSSKRSSRGWWSPVLLTAVIGSASSYLRHLSHRNTLTNARRNVAAHYDLSNALFSLFLGDSMTYSCAFFKNPTESLEDAQANKIRRMIKKAQIEQSHEVLEIGFGWGSMALEIVKQTGCKYTGITLSEEQLKFSQERVKEAGLEDKVTFLLCDYRTLPGYKKFDRIVSCEMLEAVGHEHYQEFFRRCDHLLAKDGIVVVQVITIPEERYDAYRSSSDFIKEYIFPGGCLPAFSTLTAAMTAASSLCVEHMENIGIHYYHTLLEWRQRFNANKSTILQLGFSEKFLRMWEYYFNYCAAGFHSCTLGVAQIVFSRPGNVPGFGDAWSRSCLCD
ncbi:hypothetical protein L7F22_055698 [Adiantum nelumboides]|nr:hypothetical protein [Adiantum nelumboides]